MQKYVQSMQPNQAHNTNMSLHHYIIIVTISLAPTTEKPSQVLSAMAKGNGDF